MASGKKTAIFRGRFFPLLFYMILPLLRSVFASTFAFLLSVSFTLGQTIVYVTQSGAGDQSGSSWGNALQGNQLYVRLPTATGGTQFWIGAGTYRPYVLRTGSFTIPSGVQVYGGFSGSETALSQRVLSHPSSTTFTGEQGDPNSLGDNNYHVVTFMDGADVARLDGVVVTGGNADAPNTVDKGRLGGGVYIGRCSPAIVNCTVAKNRASDGGGIYIDTYSGNQKLFIDRCVISDNSANSGGGIDLYVYAFRGILISNTFFLNNSAVTSGGGILNGSEAECRNCLFSFNSARYGGAFLGTTIQGLAKSTLINCTVVYNTASEEGGGVRSSAGDGGGSYVNVGNSILRNNMAPSGPNVSFQRATNAITYSNIQGGFAGTGNIDADPLFVDAVTGNYQLQADSPSVNTGDPNSTAASVSQLDLAGNPRIDNGRIDMGAYERQTITGPLVTVQNGNWNDPATWQQQRVPGAGDAVLIRHRVALPVSYTANVGQVQYDTNGQVIFSPAAQIKFN